MDLLIDCCVSMRFFLYSLISGRLDIHALIGCRDGCRDKLRRQGDQEAQRDRENKSPLVNNINIMGWWLREGWLLAGRN